MSEVSPKIPTQSDDDVPTGGCMPIGLTASGELVFPMQCQAILERHRDPVASQPSVSAKPPESATPPKEHQAAEPAPAADQTTGVNRDRSSINDANTKVEDGSPSGEAEPGKENLQPEMLTGKKVGRREDRPLPMNRSRKNSLQKEDQWFNPLVFR